MPWEEEEDVGRSVVSLSACKSKTKRDDETVEMSNNSTTTKGMFFHSECVPLST